MDILLELGIHFFAGFNNGSQITGLQGKGGGGISLGPHYYFQPHHRRLDISQVITAEGSPLHIDSSQTQTKNLWFLSGSCEPLGYTPLNIYILPLQTEKVKVSGY